jgi:hypothetical protein
MSEECPCEDAHTTEDCERCQDLEPGTFAYWKRLREAQTNHKEPIGNGQK